MIFLSILKGKITIKMHKIIFFPEKNVFLSYLKFSDPLPETHLFALSESSSLIPDCIVCIGFKLMTPHCNGQQFLYFYL